jgi:type III secretory pathway component EscR
MDKLILIKNIAVILLLSALFSQVSWWVLLNTEKAKLELDPNIQETMSQADVSTVSNLPSAFWLAFIAYMPFWVVTLTIIKVFAELERKRSRSSPIYQQTI